jgi:NTE family protein
MMHNMGTRTVLLVLYLLNKHLKYFLLFLLLLPFSFNSYSQEQAKRPAVGLVLSGGGAHGIAHLGVIKVMEEAGLRPDYITGVSMGSVIGGMYSLGYSFDSLFSILKKMDWELILTNKIPENKVIFLEKNNFHNSIISLPISSRKVTLPSGLINGQLVENALSYYLWPAADISDFSELPIPFMCVATDIITFKKIDLKTGYLPDAIRASIAVPSIFTPVKIDSLLLMDGGLIRNFAATEARELGADILIGSYAGFRAFKEDELQTLPGIIKQLALFKAQEDFQEQKKLVDVLINPKTGKMSKTAFENVDSLVEKGYEAALPYKEYFRKLADSLNTLGRQTPLNNILNKQYYTFDRIEIKGNSTYSDYQIRGVLEIEPGDKADKELLGEKMELLYGKVWFEKVKYRIVPRNDSLILVIECDEKPKGQLYGSVHYDNSLRAGLNLGLSVKNLFTQRSVINLNTLVAQYFRFDFNAIQFIDRNQKTGFSMNYYSDNTLIPMLGKKDEEVDMISRNFAPGLSVSRSIGLNQLMSLSMKYENTNLILQHNSAKHLKNISYNYLTSGYDYQVSSVDTKYFPDRGIMLSLSASTSKLLSSVTRTDTSRTVIRKKEGVNYSSERFFTLYGHLKYYFSPSGKITFSIGGDALCVTESDSLSSQNNFYLLGGTESLNRRSVSLIGYHSNEIPVNRLAAVRGNMDIELFKDIHLECMANIAAIQEVNNGMKTEIISGYGLGMGYMSIIGPLRIGIMYGSNRLNESFSKIKGYISIGYKF